jgi:hypothetical protein
MNKTWGVFGEGSRGWVQGSQRWFLGFQCKGFSSETGEFRERLGLMEDRQRWMLAGQGGEAEMEHRSLLAATSGLAGAGGGE